MRWDERALMGTSLTWSGPDDDQPPAWRAAITVLAVFLMGIGLVLLLGRVQASGEAPPFECNPGSTYTTKECP